MAKNNALNLKLPSADDLFRSSEQESGNDSEHIQDISLSQIDSFPDHPFKVLQDEEMERLVESVRQYGVQTPIIVRPKEDGRYELVSGHRRKLACELVGLARIPAIVRDMSRDEATIFMVDTNLQREKISPSEKAKAYAMKMEAMRRQGARSDLSHDLTCRPVVDKLKTADIVGQSAGESGRQIQRYLRLNELAPPLLELVDEGKIAMRPAVELSYLPHDQQEQLMAAIEREEATPSLAQAQRMRKFAEHGRLDENSILAILTEEKPNQREKLTLPREKIAKFLPKDATPERAEEFVIKACEHYARYLQRNTPER